MMIIIPLQENVAKGPKTNIEGANGNKANT